MSKSNIATNTTVRGFTLTEVAIVLGIIGIILGAIWAAAAMVYENNRIKQASTEVLTIVNNWRPVFGGKRVDIADNTDITQMTVNNLFAPNDMIPPAGTAGGCAASGAAATCFIDGSWSTSQVNVIAYQTNNAIGVKYTNLSQSACNHLANSLSNAASLISTTINGTTKNFPPLGTDAILTTSTVNAQCNLSTITNVILAVFAMN